MDSENDELIILLYIGEGIGFKENGSLILTATLGGNKMETEPIYCSNESTQFNNNLIWETDRNSIKRMKTESLPIKLECYETYFNYGQEIRKLIGYVLIPIRGIPIISSKKSGNNKPHWNKLIGLNAEWRPNKPEVSLYVTITDKAVQEKIMSNMKVHDDESKEPVTAGEKCDGYEYDIKKTSAMLSSQKGINIQLLQDEGLLQVGDSDNDCDIFIVKLMFKLAKNLEQIVNPAEDMNRLFRFQYNLLGTPTHCKLTPKGNGNFTIQEKIAIHFRTSIKSLKEYFTKVLFIPIYLYYNETMVGNCRFHFNNLVEQDELHEFLDKYSNDDNTFVKESTLPIITLFDLPPFTPQPYIEYVFSLKYLSTTKVGSCEIIKPQIAEYIDSQAGGDINSLSNFELPPTINELVVSSGLDMRDTQSDVGLINDCTGRLQKAKISKSTPNVIPIAPPADKMDMDSLLNEKCPLKTTKDAPRTFSFNLILQTVKFNRRPEIGIWQISLHHQKADTAYTITNFELTEISSNLIEFNNLELQLFFSSTPDQILDLISSESCALKVNGPRSFYAHAEIDNEILLVSTKEKRSGIILMENQSCEKIAMAHIFVYMDDLGINLNSQVKRHYQTNNELSNIPYMDENLAYKIVEELEEWKIKQQELFLVELKRKEVNYLGMLSAEWQTKKSEQETKLSIKLEECTKLSETLEQAHRTLQEKGVKRIEQEHLMELAKRDLEKYYTKLILDLEEKCRRTDDDLNHKIKLEELRYKELQMSKDMIQKENQRLENDLKELHENYNEMKRSYLPKEQLAGLFQDVRTLSERLDEVQKSKLFYKDQWAKIIREVHRMKSENLQKIEARLKQCRNVNLEELLNEEQKEFYAERNELNDLKTALNTDIVSLDPLFEFEN